MNKSEKPKTQPNRSFKGFSSEEDIVWSALCQRRMNEVKERASFLYWEGWDILGFSTEKIPDFNKVIDILLERTGWHLISTDIQYTDDHEWFLLLKEKQFAITEYIREMKDLDYTPLPDIFHDAFGHLPFMAVPRYADLIWEFAQSYGRAETDERRQWVVNNWWYTVEFGFIKERGEIKVFGTGLISSAGELTYALTNNVEKLLYDPRVAGVTQKSPHEMHKKLFVIESFESLCEAVKSW